MSSNCWIIRNRTLRNGMAMVSVVTPIKVFIYILTISDNRGLEATAAAT